ncbi:enoyl-[acyl-carrier-protein] reductase, mitochondrial isoform X1 [Pieris brassicae]|uniref:enoyl-[acyl-carrier-protein] reductase, mitochondrial isoform X1 n=1 Tax=Pieris brassicae TaxID=7116 RepID=UPI001E65E671|nr:enoyl-[acyl-carrier-protein] reductase, mitochondrial isoform X1 [Pieris brassicae]
MKIMTILYKASLNILKPKQFSYHVPIWNQQHRNLMSRQLVYNEFGDPLHVVKYRECEVPPLGKQDVLVRMLAAPVNPADINTIQGKYPVKVSLPSIPGNEGVGLVEQVGSEVKDLNKGNKVILTTSLQGTWRDVGVFPRSSLTVVPDTLGDVEAATLTVNPCTAFRMLCDFVCLKKDDVVIQNGGNSACGQNVIQICKSWGVKTVNIVRNRPEINDLKAYLTSLGATYVFTEEELRSIQIFKGEVKKPLLALNCVGGKSGAQLLRYMDHGGTMVTYGGMSREPVIAPTSAFIFKDMSCRGFWMTAWNKKASSEAREQMLGEIIKLMLSKELKAPIHKLTKFKDYPEVLKNSLAPQGFAGCKYLLDFTE